MTQLHGVSVLNPLKTCRFQEIFTVSCMVLGGCGTSAVSDPGGQAGTAGPGVSGSASGGTPGSGGAPGTGGVPIIPAAGASSGGASGASATGGNSPAGGGTSSTGGTGTTGGMGGGSSVGTGCTGDAQTLCWNFDSGALPAGFTPWRTAGTGQLLVDDTKPYGGSGYSLHAKDLQGGPQHTLKYVLPANWGPVMWGRLRLFTTPTAPQAHAGFFNARYPRPGQPDTAPENQLNWYEIASYQQKYMTIWHPPWPPGFPEDVQVSDTLLVIDQWSCVEWHFDGKNGDAAEAAYPKAWLNGSELAWPEHFTFSDPAGAPAPVREKAGNFTVIELGIVTWQDVPTATSWWIDDVVLGKERVGCN